MRMELAVFQELTKEITSECFFMTDSQQEEKVIQLIDLHHFIECYDPEIEIISYLHHPINIVKHDHLKKGILFYDLKHSQIPDWNAFEEFKRLHKISELWFVFVEENFVADKAAQSDFIIENSIEIYYDKIFVFNFFQSAIHSLY